MEWAVAAAAATATAAAPEGGTGAPEGGRGQGTGTEGIRIRDGRRVTPGAWGPGMEACEAETGDWSAKS